MRSLLFGPGFTPPTFTCYELMPNLQVVLLRKSDGTPLIAASNNGDYAGGEYLKKVECIHWTTK